MAALRSIFHRCIFTPPNIGGLWFQIGYCISINAGPCGAKLTTLGIPMTEDTYKCAFCHSPVRSGHLSFCRIVYWNPSTVKVLTVRSYNLIEHHTHLDDTS